MGDVIWVWGVCWFCFLHLLRVVVLLSFLFGVWRLAVAMWRGHDRLWGSHHRPSLTVLAILRTNFLYGKIESY